MSLAGSNGKSGAAASREISLACQQTMQARIRVRDRHGSCPKQTVVLTIQFSSMEHHAFHGQAVKTVVYLRVSTTQQVLGPEARTPEGLAGRLTARWQGGRNPALPRTGRFQDRHRQVWTCPVPPSTAHEHPRAQAEPLACISTRILSVPYVEISRRSFQHRCKSTGRSDSLLIMISSMGSTGTASLRRRGFRSSRIDTEAERGSKGWTFTVVAVGQGLAVSVTHRCYR